MENMQLGAEGFGEKERVVHRFGLADIRPGRFPVARFVFAFSFELVGAVGHDLTIFRMNAERQFRLRDIVESFHAHAVIGEGKITDGFAKKNLVTDGAGCSHWENIFGIRLHHDPGDTEVDQRLGFAELLLDLHLFGVGGRRHRVRHIDDRGNAAANRGGGLSGSSSAARYW